MSKNGCGVNTKTGGWRKPVSVLEISFIQRLAERMRVETGAAGIFSFRTPHVLFLLAAQERHLRAVRGMVQKLDARWPRKQLVGHETMTG